ncbi:MAG TPA: hypothetical protein PKK23_13965 [Nitrospirales bacterium]|nr:hypothetical protein [Nitrospiraceae bacterium]HNP30149.1 hypothetical protein [Nitrospirales bacterium]
MNKEERFQLYERQYYHEIEMREKLNSRLQMPFAVLVVIVGFLGYMLQNASPQNNGIGVIVFWVFWTSAIISLAIGVWFFRKSWFGHTDKLLPTAESIESYRKELILTYRDFEDNEKIVEEAFGNVLFEYYVKFSSKNAINNDARAYNLYRTIVSLTFAIGLAFLAFLPFQWLGLNQSNHPRPIKVEVLNFEKPEGEFMSERKTPPPPPPPPPPRSVKGEVPKPQPRMPPKSEKK